MIKNFFARSASIAAIAALAPVAAVYAQETASEIRGTVLDDKGAAVTGATITILHQPTGTASTLTTSANGNFFQSGLRPGGPYSITVSAAGYEGGTLEGLSFAPGPQSPLRLTLAAIDDTAVLEKVVVTGAAINVLDLNSGVGSNLTARDISNQPTLNRDLASVLARDPLSISGGPNNLSIAGVNPRFNSVTIDGAVQKDNLGLGTGLTATRRSPIDLDIVESVQLVAADYSVTASNFTGGGVNVVTKGGTNEFDGAAYYYFRDQDYVGKSTFGGTGSFNPGVFEEKEYGATLSGPIIKDKLFFLVNYSKFEDARSVDFEAADANNGLTPAFFAALNQLVINEYGIDMGGRPSSTALPEESERLFARVDWNINDNHRLQVNFQQTEEVVVEGVGALTFQSAWYQSPNTLDSYGAQLFSDWTDNLSTRLRVNYTENSRQQVCNAGDGVGALNFILNATTAASAPTLAGTLSTTSNRTIVGGCDQFRHTNTYDDERLQFFGAADYTLGDFIFTVGGEYETIEAANAFSQFSRGLFTFNSGANIVNNLANSVQYRNVTSNNTDEYITQYGYERAALFGQARVQVNPDFELSAGLRYERLTSDDGAANDPTFLSSVGIPNTTSTDGLDLLMPRFGFRYTPFDRTTVTGGFGVFAGGDPGVWTLNAVAPLVAISQLTNVVGADPTQIPAAALTAVAGGTPVAIDAIDPNFEIPRDRKVSLRLDQEFDLDFGFLDLGDDYLASAQVLYTQGLESFLWREYAQTNAIPARTPGVAPDGRPIYADLQNLGVSNRTVLTNGYGGDSTVYTLSLAKAYDSGLDVFAAYSYQDIQALTEGSSSRGVSAFRGQVAADRNYPEARNSLYETEHAFKLGLGYERNLVGDLATRIDLFGQFTSGSSFTYTFDVDNSNSLFGRNGNGENPFDNSPVYIPNVNDSRVVYAAGFNQTAFNNFIAGRGLQRGQINEVNSDKSPWNQRWDLRLQQDLPGIFGAKNLVGDNKFKLVLDIENFANLLNDDWGTFYNGPGNGQSAIVRADIVRAADVAALGVAGAPARNNDLARTNCLSEGQCVYRYNSFTAQPNAFRSNSLSTWRARIGIRYEF
ncbi:MAG: TonB-dependent receptor [Hyphomonas sp.]